MSQNSPHSVVHSVADSAGDLAKNTAADSAMNKSADSAMNKSVDSATCAESVVVNMASVADSFVDSVNSVADSLFTYLSSSKSESESEVDQVVEDFLNSTDLPEPCCHEINKCSTVLGASSLPTSEAEFSDCDDTEYMMSSDYAYEFSETLSGWYL